MKNYLPPKEVFQYSLPFSKSYENGVEPKIKPICDMINKSNWVWTAESCEGHDKTNPSTNWGTEDIFLRLVALQCNLWILFDLINQCLERNKEIFHEITICKSTLGYIVILINFRGPTVKKNRKMVKDLAKQIFKQRRK